MYSAKTCSYHVNVHCNVRIVLTRYDLYCQVIPSSGIDNYYLVDVLESRILPFDNLINDEYYDP